MKLSFLKKFLGVIIIIFSISLFSHSIHSAETTNSYSFNATFQNPYLIISYSYSGVNSYCIPLISPCGRGLFFRVFVYNTQGQQIDAIRTGTNGSVCSLTSTSCDIPYSFNGQPISGTDYVNLNLQPGTYQVQVQMAVDIADGSDTTLGTQTYTITVPSITPSPSPTPSPTPTTTNQSLSTSPDVKINVNGPITVVPSSPHAGENVTIYIPIALDVISGGPYGPYLNVYIQDSSGNVIQYFRVGQQGITTDSSTNYYFSYTPTNTWRYYNISVWFIPPTQGTYYVYIEPKYSIQYWSDSTIGSKTLVGSISVSPASSPPQNATTVSTSPQVSVQIGQVKISPQNPLVEQSVTINIPLYLTVISGGAYGPALYVYIKDVNGNTVASYRIGDQGVTTDMSANYYFSPQPYNVQRFYNITITFVPQQPGAYYVYALPKYDLQYLPDENLGPESLLGAFTVQSGQTTAGYCTDAPPLAYTAWEINGTYITSIQIGQQVDAVAYFVNSRNCTYVGQVTITVRKNIPLSPDQAITSQSFNINIPSGGSQQVSLPVTFASSGNYHFDVYYQSPYINYKYVASDVGQIFGIPGTDYAGPQLNVVQQPTSIISVEGYYFAQGNQTYVNQLVEGIPAEGCAILTSPYPTTATVTVTVYGYNVLGLQGGIANNEYGSNTTTVTIQPNQNVTVCASFTPDQNSLLHQEMFYLVVSANGQNLGTFPPNRQGPGVITQQQVATTKVVVSNAAWYTSNGYEITGGVWSPGTYYVNATLANTLDVPASGLVVKIDIVSSGGFLGLGSQVLQSCSDVVNIPAYGTASASCPVSLSDGKYYFTISINNNKVYTGPTITIGIFTAIDQFFEKVITAVGVSGIIMLVLFIFFGPYIIKGLIWMFEAWKQSAESIKEIIKQIKK
ncbi:MAG: hypothetical protein ACP5GJ_04330 [Nanopusillaceae archaeon]